MRALHLPGVAPGSDALFRFPDKPPAPTDLQYTATAYPEPQELSLSPQISTRTYVVRVLTTALTRGELTWQEVLERPRFHPYGGAIPGHDLVGIVEGVLPHGNTAPPKFAPGDRVWGLIDFDRDGAASTYATAFESELSLVPTKPSDISEAQWDEQCATIPLSGLTAFQALFMHGGLPSSLLSTPPSNTTRRVLITGAAGSVGIPTIYLAKAAGLHVTALCSASSHQLVRSLLGPSDDTIDYTAADYVSIPSAFQTQALSPVDLVVDCTGGTTLQPLLLNPSAVVKPGGRIVTIVAPIKAFDPALVDRFLQACTAAEIHAEFFVVKPNGAELEVLRDLMTQGKLRGHVDAVFELEDGHEAMELVESRGRRGGGKVVLRIARD